MRATKFRSSRITRSTLSRMFTDDVIVELSPGLYKLAHLPIEANQTLEAAAKRVLRAVACAASALVCRELTEQHPQRVWVGIGHKDWAPKLDTPADRFVRFSGKLLNSDVEHATVGPQTIPTLRCYA